MTCTYVWLGAGHRACKEATHDDISPLGGEGDGVGGGEGERGGSPRASSATFSASLLLAHLASRLAVRASGTPWACDINESSRHIQGSSDIARM